MEAQEAMPLEDRSGAAEGTASGDLRVSANDPPSLAVCFLKAIDGLEDRETVERISLEGFSEYMSR